MSNSYVYQTGLGHVGSYQISGIPWASSSVAPPVSSTDPLRIDFETVTKFIVVKNVNPAVASLRVGFSASGIKTDNYFLLGKGESFAGDLRMTQLYLLSDNGSPVSASVVAGLTGIASSNLPSSWSGSAGVG